MSIDFVSGQFRNHVVYLYAEGDEDSLDPVILRHLFANATKSIVIRPIGSCNSVESVATAFQPYDDEHQTAFFLVDKDYHHQGEVLDWECFRNGDTNLIVWRKKGLENYFIDLEFLQKSQFISQPNQLRQKLLEYCQQRLFLEIANYVIVNIRETLKKNWIQRQNQLELFSDYQSALNELFNMKEFQDLETRTCFSKIKKEICSLFERYYSEMSDGRTKLEYDRGRWLDMMDGKLILNYLLSSSGLFPQTLRETGESGREKMNTIASSLLKSSAEEELPLDFTELKEMVIDRCKKIK